MPLRFLLLVAATALTAIAQPPPSPTEQSTLIEEVRKNALAYDENLPNFICTQETRRSSASNKPGDENWKTLDTLTIRLSYFARKEDYRLVQVNGKPTDKPMDKVGGWKTRGDFGSMMHAVFTPKSQTKFEWERWDTWNGRKVAVLKFSIALAGAFTLAHKSDRKKSETQFSDYRRFTTDTSIKFGEPTAENSPPAKKL